jgi:protein-L-isoaspartate(D-aspartate) O-methyltransferase
MNSRLLTKYINEIVAPNCKNDQRIIDAFVKIDRLKFLDAAMASKAYKDDALPIGFGQTISKPSTVAFMTYMLQIKETDMILEIGTGSGFQAAILSYLADTVYTVERIPQLYQRASSIIRKQFINNVYFKIDNGKIGWEEKAPFDKIIVTAGADSMPEELLSQLKIGGKMVIPLKDEIVVIDKTKDGIETKKTKSCSFVEFVL